MDQGNGPVMRINKFDVLLDKPPNQPYYAGQTLHGQIEVEAMRRVCVGCLHVRLSGVMETGWRDKQTKAVFESRRVVLDEWLELTTTIVDHCTENFRLHEGQHCIPFSIQLPLDVVSSVEREALGSVRYTCTAVLDLPDNGGTQLVAEKEFRVFSLLNLDAPHLRESAVGIEDEKIRGCCGLGASNLSATMRVAELGLLPGDTTKITLTLQRRPQRKRRRLRRKVQHECVLISLCQQMDFLSCSREEPRVLDRRSQTVAIESHGTCTAHGGCESKEVEFVIPSDLPPTSVQADGLITLSYFFKLDLANLDVVVPVVIGSVKSSASFVT